MQLISSLAIVGLATSVAARNPAKSVGKKFDLPRPQLARSARNVQPVKRQYTVNETTPIITAPTAKSMLLVRNVPN
jgi:carboxypeptidase D